MNSDTALKQKSSLLVPLLSPLEPLKDEVAAVFPCLDDVLASALLIRVFGQTLLDAARLLSAVRF